MTPRIFALLCLTPVFACGTSSSPTCTFSPGKIPTAADGGVCSLADPSVQNIATTVTLTSLLGSPSSEILPVAFRADVSPSAATGIITFRDGATSLGVGLIDHGTATLSATMLAPGTHAISAVYDGDETHQGSTGTFTQVVNAR